MKYNDLKIQEDVVNAVRMNYGLTISSVDFFPIGEESYSNILVTEKEKIFVKYCDQENVLKHINIVNQLLLQLQNFSFVTPPLSINGKTTFDVLKGKIYAYPYVEGEIIKKGNHEFGEDLENELTKIVSQIHNETSNITIDLPKEEFTSNYKERLIILEQSNENNQLDSDVGQLLSENKTIIENLIEKYNGVGSKYKRSTNFVLTHGDVTGLNIMLTKHGIKLFDWDGATLAPAERDLMFLVDNPHFSIEKYTSVTGHSYNPELKIYYGQRWALDSIIGNFESLKTGISSKASKNDYIEEINEYLSYYK